MFQNREKLRSKLALPLAIPTALLSIGLSTAIASAQTVGSQTSMYNPVQLPESDEVTDVLSEKDIPTGFGGFARDYVINLEEGDYIVIDLVSDEFDTIITLLAPDGSTFGENDDGPDGTTNSMLFARITESGRYIMRVTPYAGQGSGTFNLKLTRLRPI
ncbi:MAG: peptidase [Elainellaceae cyanobacterium]